MDDDDESEVSEEAPATPTNPVALVESYPLEAHTQLVGGLQRLSWVVYPAELVKCLQAAVVLVNEKSDAHRCGFVYTKCEHKR